MIQIIIPGEPVAQGRPRFARRGQFVSTYDPPKSRSWKGVAQVHMIEALAKAEAKPLAAGVPVELQVIAIFSCPKSQYRKNTPRERRHHTKRPDADNILKAVKDAGTGILWHDDSQVMDARVIKIIGAQDEEPCVVIQVWESNVQSIAGVARRMTV